MKQYQKNRWGGYDIGDLHIAPGELVDNADWQRMQQELKAGTAEILPPPVEGERKSSEVARLEALALDLKALGLTVPSDAAAAEALK
jgi:hypothetical protein